MVECAKSPAFCLVRSLRAPPVMPFAQMTTFACAAALVVLTAGTAHAQWLPFPTPYPGPVIGGIFQGNHVATVRTRVTPRSTQVFVDGYSAGIADNFDGVFQRLQLIPGQHEIAFYLPGYRTYRENVYLNPGSSRDIRHTMAARAAGEVDDPAPVPLVLPLVAGRGLPPPGPPGPLSPLANRPGQYGVLALGVQPADARILVDGEEWRSSQPQDRLSLQLGEGRHHLQIEKPGFQTFTGDVDIRIGETSTVNVSLLTQ
jgi:hypothetical protein